MSTLADFLGLVPSLFNMANSPTDFAAGSDITGALVPWWTQTNASVSSNSAVGPDGTLTASSLIENSATGPHSNLTNTLGVQDQVNGTVITLPMRMILFAKAGTRTRLAFEIVVTAGGSGTTLSVLFDLAGGNTNFDNIVGSDWTLQAATMKEAVIGSGWWQCTVDFTCSNSALPRSWSHSIKLDSGSGTAARNTNYTGNGTGNVLLWLVHMLPRVSYNTAQQMVFFDDFTSLSTIDLNDTQTEGFNWYVHNRWPNFAIGGTPPGLGSVIPTAPRTLASNLSVSNSILTIADGSNPASIDLMSCCVHPASPSNFIGRVFTNPCIYEARCAWDKIPQITFAGGGGPAWWTTSVDALIGGNEYFEIDFMEADTGSQTQFRSTIFDVTIQPNVALLDGPVIAGKQPATPTTFARMANMVLTAVPATNNTGARLCFFEGIFVSNAVNQWGLTGPGAAGNTLRQPLILGAGHGTINSVGNTPWPLFVDYVRVFQVPPPVPPPPSFSPGSPFWRYMGSGTLAVNR